MPLMHNVDFDHDSTIELALDLLPQCNFKCPYCYNSGIDILSMRDITQVAHEITLNPYTFDVTMMGGEPSLHPQVSKICDVFRALKNVRNVTMYTNGHKVVKLSRDVIVHLSYHPTEIDDQTFISSVLKYNESHKVRVMVMQVPRFRDRVASLVKTLASYNIELVPIYIVKDDRAIIPKWFIPGLDKANISWGDRMISARDLADVKTSFKGCRCHMNMYTLHDGLVHRECADEVIGDIRSIRSLNMNPIICTKDRCAVTCWQDVTKECT